MDIKILIIKVVVWQHNICKKSPLITACDCDRDIEILFWERDLINLKVNCSYLVNDRYLLDWPAGMPDRKHKGNELFLFHYE